MHGIASAISTVTDAATKRQKTSAQLTSTQTTAIQTVTTAVRSERFHTSIPATATEFATSALLRETQPQSTHGAQAKPKTSAQTAALKSNFGKTSINLTNIHS